MRQAALVPVAGIAVHDAFRDHAINQALRIAQHLGSAVLVAGGHRLVHVLDGGAHRGAQPHVVDAALHGLVGALAGGLDVCHEGLGSGKGANSSMNLLRALATVSSLTLVSRILGYLRDFIIARAFGASLATDAFFVAFRIHTHSYMHCWRHKTPVILRATTQWFAAMDREVGGETLRATALRGIEQTEFFPPWGKARLQGMIANRPDWTLSRQRQWGVPMPFFLHRETGRLHPRTPGLLEEVARRVERAGIEAWQSVRGEELIGAEAAQYEKSRDTLDVWFDSGSTHYTVLRGSHKEETGFPAHLYLEGSDQHRGWFHSSLLVACMLDGIPPYKALLTHGFVVDGEGRKMSKSKGNVVAPQQVSHTLGAEVLRLWVASTDYSGELFISNEILKHVVESYRRVRNTLRFLLANTADFDAARHAVPVDELLEIDRYALAMTARTQEEIAGDYERYQFHLVAQKLPKWERLRELRNPVRKKIEELRAAGQVGSSLQAEGDFHADGGDYELLRSLGEDLKFVMLTSAARVHRASGELRVEVAPSLHRKCERCWHYRPDVDDEALCGRCRSNLHGPGEKRLYA